MLMALKEYTSFELFSSVVNIAEKFVDSKFLNEKWNNWREFNKELLSFVAGEN